MSKKGRGASSGGKSWIFLSLTADVVKNYAENTGAKSLDIIAVQGFKGRLNHLAAAAVGYITQSKMGVPNSYEGGGHSDTVSSMGTFLVSKNLQEFLKLFEELKAIKKYMASTRFMQGPRMSPINNKMEKFDIKQC